MHHSGPRAAAQTASGETVNQTVPLLSVPAGINDTHTAEMAAAIICTTTVFFRPNLHNVRY